MDVVSAASEIACPLQVALTVLYMELDGGPVRRARHPQEQVGLFACLKEQTVVAVVELGQLVQGIQAVLGIQLGI